tara:strand:- start:230 stop:427 length:198 start_codon:yes stop_codon:yes gene_type:complete
MSDIQEYKVHVAYEESFSIVVKASSEHEAEDIVIEKVKEYGNDIVGVNTSDRDYYITNISEVDNE